MDHLHIPADLKHFFQRGDLLTGVIRAAPAAKIQLAQGLKIRIKDVVVGVGYPVGDEIVGNDQLFVLGHLDIHFDAVGTKGFGGAEGDKGIFGCEVGGTAVGDNEWGHGIGNSFGQKRWMKHSRNL